MAKRAVFVSSISPHTPRHETPTATTNGGRDEANEKTRRTGNDRRHETETQDRPVPTHRKTGRPTGRRMSEDNYGKTTRNATQHRPVPTRRDDGTGTTARYKARRMTRRGARRRTRRGGTTQNETRGDTLRAVFVSSFCRSVAAYIHEGGGMT